MKTFQECCQEVAEKHGRSSFIAEIYDRVRPESRYTVMELITQAAELYRNESLKALLEEVRFASSQWQAKSDKEADNTSKAAYSMTAFAVRRIGNRIEELLSSSQRQENDSITQSSSTNSEDGN